MSYLRRRGSLSITRHMAVVAYPAYGRGCAAACGIVYGVDALQPLLSMAAKQSIRRTAAAALQPTHTFSPRSG